jgi:hypothetical protein
MSQLCLTILLSSNRILKMLIRFRCDLRWMDKFYTRRILLFRCLLEIKMTRFRSDCSWSLFHAFIGSFNILNWSLCWNCLRRLCSYYFRWGLWCAKLRRCWIYSVLSWDCSFSYRLWFFFNILIFFIWLLCLAVLFSFRLRIFIF